MNIKINRLLLQNFKGIQWHEFYVDGANLNIYGDNATGKTTVFDAFTWLLFGKDSLGRSDFGIKTQDENGNVIHNLDHLVECELAIDNSILTLKKVYAEKWTKKRGSSEAEFSGHETKYFINEVPSSKKEYEQKIASFIDENLFKTITNPLYFNEHLKWQDRRAILLSLCDGEMSDENILARSPEFAPLLEELKGRTVQEYSKIIKSKQSAINDELKAIPQRIQEATLAIPEMVDEVNESDKENIEKKIAELTDKIIAIQIGSSSTNVEVELKELKEQRQQLLNKRCDVSEIDDELSKHNRKLIDINFEISDCERNIKGLFNSYESAMKRASLLREEWHKIKDQQYTESENCPTCGQPLPAEQIAKAKANFNTTRATKLELITEEGKKEKADADLFLAKRDEWAKRYEKLQEDKKLIEDKISRAEFFIADAAHKFSERIRSELEVLDSRIAEAEKKVQNGSNDIQASISPIQEQIDAEKAKLAEIDKAIASRDIAERQKARIAELAEDEKRLVAEYVSLDKIAFLIEKFTKYKIDLLSEEINGRFKYARFKLFEEQINGGIAECCEVTYKGVDYSDLNNASRINIGLDIINTLCTVKNTTAPIVIDNAESVTNLLSTNSQMICLIVSADDDALRVEKH